MLESRDLYAILMTLKNKQSKNKQRIKMFTIKKILISMLLVTSMSLSPLQATNHNLTDTQLHAVMGIITNFILTPSSKELAFQKIKAYAQSNGSSSAPSIKDYQDAGVTGVDTTNLIELNEVIENHTAIDVDTTIEIQALVDALGSGGSGGSIIHNNRIYGTVTSPYTGKVWLDRNLGASRVCTAFNDTMCYGDYYQWGRNYDGHQSSTSYTTITQASDVNSAGSSFIIEGGGDWTSADGTGTTRTTNWSATDGSSVCPVGYRVPTRAELKAETLDASNVTDSTRVTNSDTAFTNFLKLPSAGHRHDLSGAFVNVGSWGYMWTSSVFGSDSHYVEFTSVGTPADYDYDYRAYGLTVRCLRD